MVGYLDNVLFSRITGSEKVFIEVSDHLLNLMLASNRITTPIKKGVDVISLTPFQGSFVEIYRITVSCCQPNVFGSLLPMYLFFVVQLFKQGVKTVGFVY